MADSKKVSALPLFKNGVHAGALQRTPKGCRLIFSEDFARSHRGRQFCFHIPISDQPYSWTGVGLPAYFAGLLPEGLRLSALVRRLKTSDDDLFSILVEGGQEPVGDIHFSESSQHKSQKVPNDFTKLQQQLSEGLDVGGNALAGVQEKMSADRISLPVSIKRKNKSYILKLAASKHPDQIENEFFCLKIAKACGLNVNEANIVTDSLGTKALLVERFDREWDSNLNQWRRFH
ncbi:MAG: HipA domain-containing protein, partial [bacterium]